LELILALRELIESDNRMDLFKVKKNYRALMSSLLQKLMKN